MNATAYLEATGHCHGCGRTLRHDRDARGRYYCSQQCALVAPPALLAASERLGTPPRETLVATLQGRTVIAAAGLLGVDAHSVWQWIRRYRVRKVVSWQ